MIKCDRCHAETSTHRVSWFNDQTICKACQLEELEHEYCKTAKEIEHLAVCEGNLNFKGIGLPKDLREKYKCGAFKGDSHE